MEVVIASTATCPVIATVAPLPCICEMRSSSGVAVAVAGASERRTWSANAGTDAWAGPAPTTVNQATIRTSAARAPAERRVKSESPRPAFVNVAPIVDMTLIAYGTHPGLGADHRSEAR